jgi:uncharacterized protein YjdB
MIASVSANGLVSALAPGYTTITATSQDGDFVAQVDVTVLPIPVTGIAVSGLAQRDIIIGQTLQLSATITPANAANQNVTWSSDNNGVATVNANGFVTAHTLGTATITVTTQEGGHTASFTITVIPLSVTGVTITGENTRTLLVNQTLQLHSMTTPTNATNQNVSWSSSHPNIATVNTNGLVTALAPGSTTITITTQDGGHTASVTVAVFVSVTDVTIPGAATRNLAAGQTLQLSANVAPSNAANQSVTWSSSNTAIATVNASGLVTALAPGNATITVTTQDGSYTASIALNAGSSYLLSTVDQLTDTQLLEWLEDNFFLNRLRRFVENELSAFNTAYRQDRNRASFLAAVATASARPDELVAKYNDMINWTHADIVAGIADGSIEALIAQIVVAGEEVAEEIVRIADDFFLADAMRFARAYIRMIELENIVIRSNLSDAEKSMLLLEMLTILSMVFPASHNRPALMLAGQWSTLANLYSQSTTQMENLLINVGLVPPPIPLCATCNAYPCACSPPANTIFNTRWEATFFNWLLFFLGFGWIWMWF